MTTTPNHSNGQQIQTKLSQQEIVGSKPWNQSTSKFFLASLLAKALNSAVLGA
jgi:hypothetical protein